MASKVLVSINQVSILIITMVIMNCLSTVQGVIHWKKCANRITKSSLKNIAASGEIKTSTEPVQCAARLGSPEPSVMSTELCLTIESGTINSRTKRNNRIVQYCKINYSIFHVGDQTNIVILKNLPPFSGEYFFCNISSFA